MGTGLVVATVTRTLRDSLSGWLNASPGDVARRPVSISALPPEPSTTRASNGEVTAHLYLYRIGLLAELRRNLPVRAPERGMPAPDKPGVELDYLIEATPAREFDTELVLGAALDWVHQNSVMNVQVPASEPGATRQSWQLRITPKHLAAEALAALCSAIEGRYRAHLAIEVQVVRGT